MTIPEFYSSVVITWVSSLLNAFKEKIPSVELIIIYDHDDFKHCYLLIHY